MWPVEGLEGVQVAPFQVLATEGKTWTDRDHGWHLEIADRLVAVAPTLIRKTGRRGRHRVVDRAHRHRRRGNGRQAVRQARQGAERLGVKVRGREYLRIIYGPDYTEPENFERLRARGLGRKRSMAAREYALGIESLERVTRGEPL